MFVQQANFIAKICCPVGLLKVLSNGGGIFCAFDLETAGDCPKFGTPCGKKEIGTNFVGLLFIRTESYSLLDKFADLVATLGVQSQPYLPYYQFKLLEFFC